MLQSFESTLHFRSKEKKKNKKAFINPAVGKYAEYDNTCSTLSKPVFSNNYTFIEPVNQHL